MTKRPASIFHGSKINSPCPLDAKHHCEFCHGALNERCIAKGHMFRCPRHPWVAMKRNVVVCLTCAKEDEARAKEAAETERKQKVEEERIAAEAAANRKERTKPRHDKNYSQKQGQSQAQNQNEQYQQQGRVQNDRETKRNGQNNNGRGGSKKN